MKRAAFDSSRDERIAEDVAVDSRLMCAAVGCPNRYSIDLGGQKHYCSAHHWAEPHLWPSITQQQKDLVADRARMVAQLQDSERKLSPKQKLEILGRLRDLTKGKLL